MTDTTATADTVKEALNWLTNTQKEGPLEFALKVLFALIVYIVGSRLIRQICKGLKKHMAKYGTDEAAKGFVLSFVKIGLYAVLILSIAGNFGIDKTTIAAVLGSAGVAISLALQGGLSNFAGGLILLFLRPFSVGDYIIENGEKNEGTVEKIELYYTTLMTVDSKRIVIPNSKLTNNSIINVTAMDKRRLEIKVGISYDSDIKKAKELLSGLIMADDYFFDKEDVQIFVDQLADSSVILGLRVWVKTENFWTAKWGMQEKIKEIFDENSIKIPFPQMELHLHEKTAGGHETVDG